MKRKWYNLLAYLLLVSSLCGCGALNTVASITASGDAAASSGQQQEYKKDTMTGPAKIYQGGILVYDGKLKNGTRQGKGISYYLNGQKQYDGEWKSGHIGADTRLSGEELHGIHTTAANALRRSYRAVVFYRNNRANPK